jgi:polyisoprenoid-binding protein YceI
MQKLIAFAFAFAALALAQPAVYTIDAAHSSAGFSVKHLMVSNVRGTFSKFTGSIVYDPANLAASSVEATLDAASIDTRDAKRDAHLKNPDFFDLEKFPTLTFKSRQWYRAGGALRIKGDLTLLGVTREVVLDVDGPTPEMKDPWGGARLGATATTKINRKDYGLTWNRALETGGVMVGEEVSITLEIEAVRKQPPAPAKKN